MESITEMDSSYPYKLTDRYIQKFCVTVHTEDFRKKILVEILEPINGSTNFIAFHLVNGVKNFKYFYSGKTLPELIKMLGYDGEFYFIPNHLDIEVTKNINFVTEPISKFPYFQGDIYI